MKGEGEKKKGEGEDGRQTENARWEKGKATTKLSESKSQKCPNITVSDWGGMLSSLAGERTLSDVSWGLQGG